MGREPELAKFLVEVILGRGAMNPIHGGGDSISGHVSNLTAPRAYEVAMITNLSNFLAYLALGITLFLWGLDKFFDAYHAGRFPESEWLKRRRGVRSIVSWAEGHKLAIEQGDKWLFFVLSLAYIVFGIVIMFWLAPQA